ncbi:MAG: hypothetical protein IIC09_04185, partial [Proteobacteria bacterium]|nr:hypothetical protein [Pseudomonadota bacterium]
SVLIVDPSRDTREVLRIALARQGVEVLEADQRAEGMSIARERHPDVIVVDLEDPDKKPVDPETIDLGAMDDPRLAIAARHDKKHRNFDESGELVVESDDSIDIIETDDPDPEMVEVKIYGETRLVEKSKVDKAGGVQAYQKAQAVDAGMQANAEQRDILDTRATELDERERRVTKKEAAPPTPGVQDGQDPPDLPASGDQTIEELANKYQEAVYEGDESAPILLTQLVQKAAAQSVQSQSPPIDVEKIKQEAADEFERRERQKKVTKATRALYGDHPELNRKKPEFDQRLFQAIDDETTVVERQNPDWDPKEVINEAWKRISEWHGTHKTTTMTDKAAQKRAMNRPRASSGRYVKPTPPPEKTASDYVKKLRESRGQGV